MPKVIPGRVTWLSPLPRRRRTTPNYSRRARMLLIKQINDLDFFTVRPTLPLPPSPGCQFFMNFRGPKAHPNRSHTSDRGGEGILRASRMSCKVCHTVLTNQED